MAFVELHRCCLILPRISRTIGLMFVKNMLYFKGEPSSIALCILEPLWDAESRTGKNQTDNASWFRKSVVNCQHTAPRMPKEMDFFKVKRLADLVKFFDKSLRLPEMYIIRLLRFPTTELIVEDDRSLIGQTFKWFEIIMRKSWASVKCQ